MSRSVSVERITNGWIVHARGTTHAMSVETKVFTHETAMLQYVRDSIRADLRDSSDVVLQKHGVNINL